MNETEWIWKNGELVPWAEATTHVMTHALHYGSSVFEGIRVYETPDGPRFFRLPCHARRLYQSAVVHGMDIPIDQSELEQACHRVVERNGLRSAYVRPLAYRGYGALGLDWTASPVDVIVAAVPWGRYLGSKGIEEGIDVRVSSWRRFAPDTVPALAKAGGNYLNNQLVLMEAKRDGYTEGIALTHDGLVSEGSGENLFCIHDGVIYTPGIADGILIGITRATAITIARELGHEIVQRPLPREFLYLCDEIFMTGTAAEITPVRSVDRIPVGKGEPGPITKAVQEIYFGLFDGSVEDRHGWLQAVEER